MLKKAIIIVVLISAIFCFLLGVITLGTVFDVQGGCLDDGGCWDYIRNRCEMHDQGYCEKDEQDCTNRNGIWQEDKKYCILRD